MMKYICLKCKSELVESDDVLTCQKCMNNYHVINGIVCFLEKTDSFYEGRFVGFKKVSYSLPVRVLLRVYHAISISSSRERFFRKAFSIVLRHNPAGKLKILDIGCGGGREQIARYGEITGIDISFKSLMKVADVYNNVVCADAQSMPFADNTFDVVFSSDFFGHIPPGKKDAILKEIFRITKKGGFTCHSIECDSESLFYTWARKHEDLFRKYFIDMYGHHGLELYFEAFEMFRTSGFIPVLEKTDPAKGYLREVSSYPVFFDNEYKDLSLLIKFTVIVCKLLSLNKYIRIFVNFTLGIFVPLAALVTPISHRDSLKVLYRKP